MYITCKCWIILLFLFSLIWRVNTYKAEQIIRRGPGQDPQCADPLINSADKFPDASFSSSSVWKNATDFQPFRARLTEVYGSNEHTSGYAWCPNTHVEDGLREWIQAEFSHLVIISVIFTVGRGDGNVKEYMPNFVLRYQREDNGIWYEHVKSDGTRVLKANSDPRNIARTTLDSVVIAKRIRIYPYSHRSKQQVCLRFALYGCNFPDGVTSYSMPQGDTVTYGRPLFGSLYSVPHSFQDLTYDGQLIESDNQLMGGIGQLMDNVAYLGNVTLLSDSHPTQPGFHFVGWQIPNRDLRIVFKFDEVRSFIWLRIFTFDSIPLQSRVFSRAVVEFSMDGKSFGKPVEILTSRARMVDPNQISSTKLSISDMHSSRVKRSPNSVSTLTQETIVYSNRDWDGALVVQMPLTSHTGRYVSLTLTPSDSWILLSEVQFNSTIVQPESLLANNEEVDSLTKSVGGNSNSGDSHEQNSHLDVNLFRNSPLAADPETNKQANKMNSGSEVQSPIVGNEKSSISTHDERLSGAESSSNGENYYLSSSSSAAASASASSSSSKSMSTSTTPSTQLPQIIVIVSYVLGGILSLFILLALIIIVQRRCRHHLHFKHQCCKQLAVETTGISSSNPSGGFYSPISLIGAYGNNNNPNNNNNSLMNYNVVNTMNIPEAAKLLQSIPTLSPNARTTENFVHNCLPNGSGGVGVVHHPNSLLQYAMNNSNNNNNNTSVTDSNSVIVNNNNNNNTNNTRFGGTGGVGKLDYVSSVPPPLPPANLLLPRVPQTTMYGGVSDANVNSTTTNNNDQFIAQTSLYMQTNPNRLATTLVASDLNSLGGMSPEYASASIFGFTPPPSDLSDGVSINCGDNNIPSNYYRPIVSRLGNYPMSGLTALNTNHNGPTSLPLTGPTYELHTTHISPNLVSSNTGTIINNTGQFHSTLNQQNPAGFLFLPRSQIGEGGFTGAGNMINRISLTANQFQQLNQNNTPFISTINGDPYNIYQAAGMNLPVQSNLQMHQHNHHQQQQQQLQLQQPVEYKLPKRTDDITWQSSLMNPESTMIHSEPQTPLTEQCLSNSETSWPGTVNNNSNNNGNNNYRTLNITEMKNGTLKNNYFLPVMNTSTTLNSNYNNNNNINDERSYFPSHQLIYPSFPPPPISGTLMITTSIASQPQQSSLQTTTITTAAATNTVTSNGPNMSSRGSPVGAAATSTGPDGGGGYTVNESTNSGPPMSFYSVCI
uniref:F5/8 type C domain-containing protein n=1 Tax=Trichobilharzia regenti TaxID=157069 RepID=A0AA85K0H4_TRIRE|nr:unnamed protein product [Trichobilharzia regenti]